MHVRKMLFASAAALIAGCSSAPDNSMPQPVDGGDSKGSQRRAYIEQLHRSAPGDDWRAIDAATMARDQERRLTARRQAMARGADEAELRTVRLGSVSSGQWHERGSGNQAGRVIGADIDPLNFGRIIVYAHGGQLWQAQRALLDWSSLNDSVQFVPNGLGGSFRRLAGTPDRLLVASDRPSGLYYSDDLGQNWTAASGFTVLFRGSAQGLAERGGADEVYLLRNYHTALNPNPRPKLFASTDRGGSFSDLGFVGQRNQTALFAPRHDSSEVYLLEEFTLKRIEPGTQNLVTLSTVPAGFPIADRQVLLTGGVTTGGVTFLYAIYATGISLSDSARVFRSLDGGMNWTERTQAPTGAFSFNSAASSTRDPDKIYLGGVELYRSHDGAASWQRVNAWTEYYTQPGTRLHADIPAIDVFYSSSGFERILISTDGGLYESTDDLVTVENLSLSGLNVSQYYGSATRPSATAAIFAGSQDQGLQRALVPGSNDLLDFEQRLSGDHAHLVLGNNATWLWSSVNDRVFLDLTPIFPGTAGFRHWIYASNGFTGGLFLAPLAAHSWVEDRVYLGGGRIGAGAGHHIIELGLTGTGPGSIITATSGSHDFGDVITAIATSKYDVGRHYAMTAANEFFRSTDSGSTWTNTASNLPQHQHFWGQRILPHPTVHNRVFVAGSGYSNPAVFVSDNAGLSFTPFNTGLPDTLVLDLAISPDGTHLFAATEVGAYWYDAGQGSWIDIVGTGGPAQSYWDVDFVAPLHTARFSTYGRGIWDFKLDALEFDPVVVNFGTVTVGGGPFHHDFNLTNVSQAEVLIQIMEVPPAPLQYLQHTCPPTPFTLLPLQACQLRAVFDPISPGSFQSTPSLASSPSNATSFTLKGKAVSAADGIFYNGFQ